MKLLAAVMAGIKHIAADPYAARFCLSGPLRRYGRLKGLGGICPDGRLIAQRRTVVRGEA